MISQTLKDNSEVFGMFFLAFGTNENIIDKDHDEFFELRHKHGVHVVHEVSWGIRETKRHYQELVKIIMSGESGFRNVTRSNFDLMITRTKVNLGEDFGSSQLIKKNIDSGKRIFVLDGDCIEQSVIHTHSQATIFLFDEKEWGNPKVKSLGEYNPYLTIPGVGFSVRLILWVAYDKVFWKWVQYPVGVRSQT
jgi:hypothetical protein